MNKMNELFVETINKALTAADVMSDVNRKPTAYASIALALATYLKGEQQTAVQAPPEELMKMSDDELIEAFNKTPLELIDDEKEAEQTVAQAPVQEPQAETWALPYDENGIPYLTTEDYSFKERVLAYENAMTPELEARKKAIEQEKGRAVLNEPVEPAAQATAQATAPAQQEVDPKLVEAIENFKVCFGYDQDPTLLDNMVIGYTSGVITKVDDLTPDLYVGFTAFVMDENCKALDTINALVESEASWLNIDAVVAEVWQDSERNYENTINDGNVAWFAGYLKEYVARAYLNSYIEGWGEDKVLKLFKEFSEDGSVTFNELTSENVVQFVNFLGTTQAA